MKITQPAQPVVVARNVSASGVGVSDPGGFWPDPATAQAVFDFIAAGGLTGYLRTTLGGIGNVQALGTLGATETIDLANANLFWGTLDQDCTITMVGWTNLKDAQITVLLFEDGTGGWEPTFAGVTWDGGGATPTHDTTAGTFTRYVFTSHDGGTTIIGAKTGSAGGSAIEVLDEGVSLTAALVSLDFVGAGVTATTVGDDVTVTIPGSTLTADDIEAMGFVGPIVMADGTSSPPEPVETEDGEDWVYADL